MKTSDTRKRCVKCFRSALAHHTTAVYLKFISKNKVFVINFRYTATHCVKCLRYTSAHHTTAVYLKFISKNKVFVINFRYTATHCIKPIALANVRISHELLGDKISIFGVGGIKTGIDAFEFLLAGADAVQVATVFEEEGNSCFARINLELEKILQRKDSNSIEGVKGKLKYL